MARVSRYSKQSYTISIITKGECAQLLLPYHYLSSISKGFKSGINYGLWAGDVLVGVCIFTGLPVAELAVGCFGLDRKEQEGLYELSRLCLHPEHQRHAHNLASWFLSRCLKLLKKHNRCRAVLSYADTAYHQGTVYAACNFKYYGMTASKKDFWIEQADGIYVKHSRGKTKGVLGEWRARTRKHRFLFIYDKFIYCLWEEEKWQG